MRWCLLAALAAQADAQRLNLGGPDAPRRGTSLIAEELAQRFERGADRFAPLTTQTNPNEKAVRSAKRELRLAAAELARMGDNAGTEGSHLVLTAMTIDRRLEELDELIETPRDRLVTLALAADLKEARVDWGRGELLTPEQLDRDLRFAFAQLALVSGSSSETEGWVVLGGSQSEVVLVEILAPLAEAGVSDVDLSRLRELADRLELMASWPGYQREARARRSLIVLAADTVLNFPVWLAEPARNRLINDFAATLDTADPESRDKELMLLIAQGRIIEQLTEMGPGRQADRLRSRASQALAERSTPANGALAATELAVQTLDTAEWLGNIQRDESLLRQVRIAWRSLIPDVRNATVNARDAAINLLVDPNNLTNPAELTAITTQETLASDFRSLVRFSERFSPGDSSGDRANEAIADRLLALGQDMDDPELRELSLGLFRELDAQLDLWDEIEQLREPADRVIGDRRNDMSLRLQNMQNQWLAGWGTPGGRGAGEGVAEDLKLTRDVMRTLADVHAFTDLSALESWPGFEMSPATRRLVTYELTGAVDGLASELIRGPSEISRQRTSGNLISLRGSHGPALLSGRLARLANESGLAVGGTLGELGFGPPVRESWMADHRDAIADVSWYSAELSRQVANDPDLSQTRTQETRAHLLWRALRTLEAIERDQ